MATPSTPAPRLLRLARLALPRAGVVALLLAGTTAAIPLTAVPAATAPNPRWAWPLEPRPAVVRHFEPPPKPWLSGHRGVDLAAGRGSPVLAPADGTVAFAGWVVDRPVLTIDHGGGLRSSFEPVATALPAGTAVARGQPVGTLEPGAAGHCPPADCLHWGVRRGDDYVDPLQFVEDRRPSVLLPWDDGPPGGPAQTIAETPVMARPATRVLTSCVPS